MDNQELKLTINPEGVTRQLRDIQESSSKNILFGLQTLENLDKLKEPHDLADNEGFFIYSVYDRMELPEIQRKNYKEWLVTKGIEDLIKGVNLTLIDTYSYGLLFKSITDIKTTNDLNDILSRATKKTKKLGLPDLLTEIKPFLREPLTHENIVLSINRVRNCLVHRDGLVTDIDIKGQPNNQLTLEYKRFKLVKKNDEGEMEVTGPFKNDGTLSLSVADKQINFNRGDKINIGFRDFNDIVFTLSLFGKDLTNKLLR